MNVRVKKYQQIIGIKKAKKVNVNVLWSVNKEKKQNNSQKGYQYLVQKPCATKNKKLGCPVFNLPSGAIYPCKAKETETIPEGLAASPIGSPRPRNPSKIEWDRIPTDP